MLPATAFNSTTRNPPHLAALIDTLDLHSLAYAVGSIGIVLEWRAYWLPGGRAFRRWSATGALFWAGQYFLLDAWTAGLNMAGTALRTLLSAYVTHGAGKHWTAAGFTLAFTAFTVFSWQGPISLAPGFATINTTFALFYLDNRRMRIALLASSLAWIGNDWYWQAWPALLAESVAMLVNARTIIGLYRQNSA